MDTNLQSLATLPKEQVLSKLETSEKGLSIDEVKQRQKVFGKNTIIAKKRRGVFFEAISHAANPLVAILIIAALISGLTGNLVSAIIINTIIFISIVLDYFQSHKALVAVKKLQEQIAATATVLRNNNWIEVLCDDLVPGDIIRLSAGDMIPADCILLTSKDVHVQQSALTGESLPVEKEAVVIKQVSNNMPEAINCVFSGSSIISGKATAVVVATGHDTLFGNIAESLSKAPSRTEFEKGIIRFGTFIMKVIFLLVIFVLAFNIYLHRPLLESILFAIALAVGLTPELLPMITTVTLAAGAVHMAKKNVIVKNLSAIQNFGSIDILCSDKTGTLTSGEMTLDKVIDSVGNNSEYVMLFGYLTSLFGTEISNPFNSAVLKKANLNPLDIAILKHNHPDVQSYNKIDEIPFDFVRRRSSVVVDKSGEHVLIAKGAPEHIFKICTHFDDNGDSKLIDDPGRNTINSIFESLSGQGYRVLAVAYRKIIPQPSYKVCDEKDMVLLGFLAFNDPPLADASELIKKLKFEGVSVKILTGDNDLVARHVCEQVGLDASNIIIGDNLEHIDDQALAQIAERTSVFARVAPAQKLRIITALRTRGHVVGYIGDGINDAPSLHSADVGISVANAVDIAREAADIILLKRHLQVLLNGILEGRKSFGNVMKYLMMGTSSNFGNMLSMTGAVLFIPFLPMLPTQILLNNLLYDISQVSIPTDNVDSSFIRKPRHWDIDIIRKFMIYIGPISSIFDFLTFYVMLRVFAATEPLFQTGWFVESLATQTLVIFVIRTAKNPWKSKPSLPLMFTVFTIVAIGILLPFSPLAKFWSFVPLPPAYFVFLTAATIAYLFLVEILKNKLMWHWLKK
ncbi:MULTISPECIES: magnesium-translocating P-type ATPase [Legionella]|mgnify:CR=1 FL=1|uniref:Magnesium-transporting ATPase, P-type 1 n=1 Tax=Legionella steelei TaxID=947033 RepID=A0A0W0ZIU9_9GAMM|nr:MULTISPECIES: magnesium-translocating P-type ATPase [Legionella]KTD69041.1 magnesium transporter [Legionella steelei]MBN9228513.1 magnesium-translocating P-type ATPase [Legionella steelei]OJW08844.1 MAG: magnesium-translocating P-type ATPase [Legionella sp. 39-23]